ncbi:MAG TPA: ATP-binding cassette domain-containing protein [Thermoplasmata archaeon]|nr:ATP-binding cassette domain-containing protein [Thermoplasmata archaeon]
MSENLAEGSVLAGEEQATSVARVPSSLRARSKPATATRSPGKPIIEVRNLVKVYGGGRQEKVKAVDDVSFSVGEGEFFGFLGPNGAGKSTVIKIITTLLAKTSGSVSVAGLDVDTGGAKIRRIIGYTGQSIGVDGELTGRENLWLIGRLYHMPNALVNERVEELLGILQLKDAADRRAYTYSGGMRRRLDLGAGLVHHPRILFLDEPTTGLDPQTRNAVWEYLRRLHKEEGMTIFLTTQYMEEADQLCGRLAIIDQGKIVAEGSPTDLKASIGADVITVRISRDEAFEQNRERALALVRQASGVSRATAFDEGVSAHTANGGATLLEILRRLDAEKVPVLQVALAHPTLDEVFLQHTGRQMRVEEVKPMSRGFGRRRR